MLSYFQPMSFIFNSTQTPFQKRHQSVNEKQLLILAITAWCTNLSFGRSSLCRFRVEPVGCLATARSTGISSVSSPSRGGKSCWPVKPDLLNQERPVKKKNIRLTDLMIRWLDRVPHSLKGTAEGFTAKMASVQTTLFTSFTPWRHSDF